MKIDIDDIIALDDGKKYLVINKVNLRDIDYIYIIDIENTKNYKFAEIENDSISVIEPDETELLEELIHLFGKDAKEVLKSLIDND